MDSPIYSSIIVAFVPILLGVIGFMSGLSRQSVQLMALLGIAVEFGAVLFLNAPFTDSYPALQCSLAILLSGFCASLGQRDSTFSASTISSILIVLGLSLGVLFAPPLLSNVFLIGLLGFTAFTLYQFTSPSRARTMSFALVALAIVLIVVSSFAGGPISIYASLFLSVIFLPLVPFHFLFVTTVSSTKGTLPSFWVITFFSLGLAEFHAVQADLSQGMFSALAVLAFVSAVYASFTCLGQREIRRFLAFAAIAQLALLWGLLGVFEDFSSWGISFGSLVGFIISGLLLVEAFVQQRFGTHVLGHLAGLAAPMPRLGIILVLFISLATLLPIVPLFSGLVTMAPIEQQNHSLLLVTLTCLVVWLFGSWHFSHMLHHTAFGKARHDIPYSDLQVTEILSLALILVGASYSALAS
ncbi:MAG: hypothetical protein NPIRA05_16280 [Nitrospirales bacterium]|nr:MAG: hypothetical protein NPIRA05_16280 [Nitrospirales bacterium]